MCCEVCCQTQSQSPLPAFPWQLQALLVIVCNMFRTCAFARSLQPRHIQMLKNEVAIMRVRSLVSR